MEKNVPFTHASLADIDSLLGKAQHCLKNQDYAAAESACRQILARSPDSPDALGLMGIIEAQSLNHRDAITFFRLASDTDPTNSSHLYNLSLSLKAVGEYEAAEIALRQLHERFPGHASACRELGELHAMKGDFEGAKQWFDVFLQMANDQFHTIQPSYRETLGQLVYQYANTLQIDKILPLTTRMQALGYLEEAEAALSFVLDVSPCQPMALEQMAELMLVTGNAHKALAAYLAIPEPAPRTLEKITLAMRQTGTPFQILLFAHPCDKGVRLITDANALEQETRRLSEHDHQKWQGEIHLLEGLRHALSSDQPAASTLLHKWITAPTLSRVSLPGTTNPAFLMVIDFSSDRPDGTERKQQALLAMAASFSHQPEISACFVQAFAQQLGMAERYQRALDLLAQLSSRSPEDSSPETENPSPAAPSHTPILAQITQGERQQELAVMLQQAQATSFYYTIDIVGACNLKCASCPNGNSDPTLQKHGLMSLATFRQIMDKIHSERGDAKIRIDLYNWGEPCQHPHLPEFISIVKEAGYKCGISCNLSRAKSPEALISAKPDFIRVSLSGSEQSVYGQTHNGGDIESVKTNLRKLRAAIDRFKANTIVQIGYLLYRHNCGDDLTRMRHLCDELDFLFAPAPAILMPLEKLLDAADDHVAEQDRALIGKLLVPPVEMRAIAMPYRNKYTGCTLRTSNLSINFDGSVPLCCAVYDKKFDIVSDYLLTPEKEIQKQREVHPLCTLCTASMSDFAYNSIRFPGLMDMINTRVDELHAQVTHI